MVSIVIQAINGYRTAGLGSYGIWLCHINTLGVADRNVPIRIQKAVIPLEPLHGEVCRLFEKHFLADQDNDGAPLA